MQHIRWYRSKIDPKLLRTLMRKSDARAFLQVVPQLIIYLITGTIAYICYLNLTTDFGLLQIIALTSALFIHGTNASFFGGVATHELGHKTPFESLAWNTTFIRIFSFLSWFDYTGFRVSHVKHHQSTTHIDYDGEVVLPVGLTWHGIGFFFSKIFFNPIEIYRILKYTFHAALGDLSRDGFFKAEWLQRAINRNIANESEIINWSRVLVLGHSILGIIFIITGNWFLIVIVTFGSFLSSWLVHLCGAPQHVGLASNTPDFRLCCRTYTCGFLPGFLYWNMQYHIEHHMFPAVPFYNLPRLHVAIKHDLPDTTHGLLATWKELIPIMKRQRENPNYIYIPRLPVNTINYNVSTNP